MKLKSIMYALGYGKSRKQLVRSEGARRVKQAEKISDTRRRMNYATFGLRYGMSFEKIDEPREGWFDGICPITATNEAKMMEKDFGAVQNASLDDWDFGDEW